MPRKLCGVCKTFIVVPVSSLCKQCYDVFSALIKSKTQGEAKMSKPTYMCTDCGMIFTSNVNYCTNCRSVQIKEVGLYTKKRKRRRKRPKVKYFGGKSGSCSGGPCDKDSCDGKKSGCGDCDCNGDCKDCDCKPKFRCGHCGALWSAKSEECGSCTSPADPYREKLPCGCENDSGSCKGGGCHGRK